MNDFAPEFRFRLIHLFYATAIIGASLATFGPWGVALAGVVLGCWVYCLSGGFSWFKLFEVLASTALLMMFVALILPALVTTRTPSRRVICQNNLKQIALALHMYHEAYGSLPPAYVPDEQGRPMHSWRVLILPYLEEQALYQQYDFNEPWNGPNNRKLLKHMPFVYRCPSHESRYGRSAIMTSYFAITGQRTLWPGAKSTTLSDVPDGTGNTLAILEGPGHQVEWMAPRDLSLKEAVRLMQSHDPLDGGHITKDYFSRQGAFADSSVRSCPLCRPTDRLLKLFQVDDGSLELDALESPELESPEPHQRRVNWGDRFRLAVFLILIFLPAPWAWQRRRRSLSRNENQPSKPE